MSVLLSILIPSVKSREKNLYRLLKSLEDQIVKDNLQEKIEIIVFQDSMEYSVGHKCNVMIEMAKGLYVTGIGDDDYISENYCKLLCETIEKNSDVDQISFGVKQKRKSIWSVYGKYSCKEENFNLDFGLFKLIFKNFGNPEKEDYSDFYFSIFNFKLWYCKKNSFLHFISTFIVILFMWNFRGAKGYSWTIIPIKKEIAVKVKFTDIDFSEDAQWVMKLRDEKLINTEIILDQDLYFYHYKPKNSLVRGKHQKMEKEYKTKITEFDIDIPNLIWV